MPETGAAPRARRQLLNKPLLLWIVFAILFALYIKSFNAPSNSLHSFDNFAPIHPFDVSGQQSHAIEDVENRLEVRQTSSSGTNGHDYTCSEDRPCSNGACCGESGFCGYGPTYCGDGCTSNCNATAECGQYSESGDEKCPLNVCCSEWGFCGTTTDFCTGNCQSNCGQPNRPNNGNGTTGGDVRDNLWGYYETWKSSGSNCGIMEPSQIPVEALQGVYTAFAYVTTGSYQIVPMPGQDKDIFQKVADIKKRSPDTKVYVSIGGWTFNDNTSSTREVFTHIASNYLNSLQFGKNLALFMNQYGFDGADLDWEYPGAPDRSGRTQDVTKFPEMLQWIRVAWNAYGKSDWGLTITVPTSYWYLRWFDLPALAKYVNAFNVMAYDLHGIWDSTDPIGPYVYAHTNLTEIDLALDLFWRSGIPGEMLNMGLAFYGRAFELKDPSCSTPGCEFSGPASEGPCTKTAGFLSWREIQNILNSDTIDYDTRYDETAGVNYMVWNKNQWISYDNKETFQQKIEFANQRGLNGIFIWAVDQDDDYFNALKAVTGKDIAPTVAESDTLGHFDVNSCYITHCGDTCLVGWTKMTGLNEDKDGVGCPNSGKNSQQRELCCPPWSAPDPSTCSFNGNAEYCYGQCAPGEVLFATDNFGHTGWCREGKKAFCCPATSGNEAVAACKTVWGDCPDDAPHFMTKVGDRQKFCCPEAPTWNNCGWHGASTTCNNNRCPVGQVELTRSQYGDNWWTGCVLGRQKAYCCDPPFDGTAFIPASLDQLFTDGSDFPIDEAPVYYEAFDHNADTTPEFENTYTDDPNKEPFAWTIMVGAKDDVQSLRKRDGSQLEAFDCPSPAADDFSTQSVNLVCLSDGVDHDCEDIMLGGVKGTIVRLPEDCGPDEWVRAVSFRQLENHPVPSHLVKRAPENAKIYQLRYDYNFRQLRRDGGEIHVRLDTSDHAGYWDEIVTSDTDDAARKRSEDGASEDWREFHMSWFREQEAIRKRGVGDHDSWWSDRFLALLNGDLTYGIHHSYSYDQVLYSASVSCPGNADASIEAKIGGNFETTLDFGITLVGTLRDFDFSQAYAYFRMRKTEMLNRAVLEANAVFQMESEKVPIVSDFDPFGGSFNLKGLWVVGPYFSVDAQLQALVVASGSISAGVSIPIDDYTWMYPQQMGFSPDEDDITLNPIVDYTPKAGIQISGGLGIDGSVTMTIYPSMGFQIQLGALGVQLVDSKVSSSFTLGVTLHVGANSDGDCDGAIMALDLNAGATIELTNPLPGWDFVEDVNWDVMPLHSIRMKDQTCYPWSGSVGTDKRSIDPYSILESGPLLESRASLESRALLDVLFPDNLGAALGCPTDFTSDTGDCNAAIPGDYGQILKRDDSSNVVYEVLANTTEVPTGDVLFRRAIEKRSSKDPFFYCNVASWLDLPLCPGDDATCNNKQIQVNGISFPSSGDLVDEIGRGASYTTYGPTGGCDDYTFDVVNTPAVGTTSDWAAEHILEWQLFQDFLLDLPEYSPYNAMTFPNQADANYIGAPAANTWQFCTYMWFWWREAPVTYQGLTGSGMNIVAKSFPGNLKNKNELQILDQDTNKMKERLWGTGVVRTDSTMNTYNANNPNTAINVVRHVMFAVQYQQITSVENLLVSQATRIGTWLDDIENLLVAGGIVQGFNTRTYTKLNLGNAWRKYVYNQWSGANVKQQQFLRSWVTKIVNKHTPGNAGSAAGGAQAGGGQTNTAIVNRVKKMKDAYDDFLLTPWTNPFPAAWA